MITVLASEAEKYQDLSGLEFERPRYHVRGGLRRQIRLLAPIELARSEGRNFELTFASDEFRVTGSRTMLLKVGLGIAVAKLTATVLDDEATPREACRPSRG